MRTFVLEISFEEKSERYLKSYDTQKGFRVWLLECPAKQTRQDKARQDMTRQDKKKQQKTKMKTKTRPDKDNPKTKTTKDKTGRKGMATS